MCILLIPCRFGGASALSFVHSFLRFYGSSASVRTLLSSVFGSSFFHFFWNFFIVCGFRLRSYSSSCWWSIDAFILGYFTPGRDIYIPRYLFLVSWVGVFVFFCKFAFEPVLFFSLLVSILFNLYLLPSLLLFSFSFSSFVVPVCGFRILVWC